MGFSIGEWFGQTATNKPRIQAKQSKHPFGNHIKGNLPKAIENLGDLITVDESENPSKVTINKDKFSEALESQLKTLAKCIPDPMLQKLGPSDNLSHSLCEIGRFLGRQWQAIENSESKNKKTIAVCLKRLEDITSGIGLIEAFSKDNDGKGTKVKLDDKSNDYLQGFESHWDRQDIKVSSWSGKITRVGNKQKKATTGLQAWGKYFSDFREFHTADRKTSGNQARKRSWGDSASRIVGRSTWTPFTATQITADKLNAHNKKSLEGLTGKEKAQQCLSNAQNAINHGDFTNATGFLQKGINALTSDVASIASPELLASLMVESVLVKHPDKPNILNTFDPNNEPSLGAFIQETNIDAIPETNFNQIDKLNQHLKTALKNRQDSLKKVDALKSLKKYNMGRWGEAPSNAWGIWTTARFTDLRTVKPSKPTGPKPNIVLVRSLSNSGGARDAREVLVSLAQGANSMPKTGDDIHNKLDGEIQANVTMVDNAPNINVTIDGVMKTLTPEKALILVQRLNDEKTNPTGDQIPFGDRMVTCDSAGAIRLVAVPPNVADGAKFLAAARNGSLTANQIQASRTKGVDINHRYGNEKGTALHHAALKGHTEVVKALLKKGADVNLANNNGVTALHLAAREGKTDVVKALLKAGIDINVKANDGSTPLHHAAFHGHTELVEKLLEAGANVNIEASDGNTPLQDAIRKGKTAAAVVILNHYAKTFGGCFEIDPTDATRFIYVPPNGTRLNGRLTNAQTFINNIRTSIGNANGEKSFDLDGFRFTFDTDKKITKIEP